MRNRIVVIGMFFVLSIGGLVVVNSHVLAHESSPSPTTLALPEPTPATLAASSGVLQFTTNEPLVISPSVMLSLQLQSGRADQYKLWNAGTTEPATFTAMPPMENTGTFVVPWMVSSGVPGSSPCTDATVYGRFHDTLSGDASAVMSDTIAVDLGVDAEVTVANPGTGDPSYTNIPFYTFNVQARPGECSRLKRVRVWEEITGLAETVEDDVEVRTAQSFMPLISDAPGDHSIMVHVTDASGHEHIYRRFITLDTAQPHVTAGAGSLTMIDAGSNQILQTTNTSAVTLLFNNVVIEDDLDGNGLQKEGAKPFWGVELANSRTYIPISDTAKLDTLAWSPVSIPEATSKDSAYTFTSAWDLFSGLTQDEQSTGAFYVYARVLDAAGNSSVLVMSTGQLMLGEHSNTTVYTTFLPLVVR